MNARARRATALFFGLALAASGCEKKHDHADHPHHAEGDGHGKGHGEGHGKGHGEGHGEGDEHHHHKDMRPSLKSFHDVLAPVYHAEKGAGRTDKACADAAAMAKAATGVAEEKDVDKAKADALGKSIADLQATCQGDKAGVDGALEKVHDAFHAFLKEK